MEKAGVNENVIKLIVIGGSAGSLDVLLRLLPALQTSDLPIIVVVHRKSAADTLLIDLLGSRTSIPVKEADEKEMLMPGVIYVAPADYHLLVEADGTLSLDASEKINYSRPSIDVTFESAAEAFGSGIAAILLSGANSDGAAGLRKIKEANGFVIVQNPATADVPYMPQQALNATVVDLIFSREDVHAVALAIQARK